MSIPMNIGFNILAPAPIDARMRVSTFNSLALIPVKYDGMVTFVIDERSDYRYTKSTNTWKILEYGGSPVWGSITGSIDDQLDLVAKFDNYALKDHTHTQKPPLAHTHSESEITDLDKYTKAEVDVKIETKSPYSTGLVKFGALSINPSGTSFDVGEGIGILNEWTPEDPFAPPVMTTVEFGPFENVAPQFLTTFPISYVAIWHDTVNDTTSVVQSSSPFTPEQRRDLIVLGYVQHTDRTSVDSTVNTAVQPLASTSQVHDLFASVGMLSTTGNVFTPSGFAMTIDKTAGAIFKLGINAQNNYKDPHNLPVPQTYRQTFKYRTRTGEEGESTDNLDPNFYDLDGVITAVPEGKVTTQRIYIMPDTTVRVQYGQIVYPSVTMAVGEVQNGVYYTDPVLENEAVQRAFVVMTQGMNEFLPEQSDVTYKFLQLGKFLDIKGNAYALSGITSDFPTASFEAILSDGKSLGKYRNGDIVRSYTSADDMLTDLGREAIAPKFNNPYTTMTVNTNTITREVGTTLSGMTFLAVSHVQDSGGSGIHEILKNGVAISGNPATDTIILTTANISYKANIWYDEGTEPKYDSLGNAYPNTISEGWRASSTVNYRGYRRIFYANFPTEDDIAYDSATVRALEFKRFENSGNTFTLATGTTNKAYQIWLPTGVNLVSITDSATDENIKSSYVGSPMTVNDAGGSPVNGTLYTMKAATPYSSDRNHVITIN